MSADNQPFTSYEERLLQGVFARVWKYLAEIPNTATDVTKATSAEQLKNSLDLAVRQKGVDVETMLSDIDRYLSESVRTSHPHFMNPLWGGTNISSLAGEIISALTNTSMYTFELAPMATLIELEMIKTMSRLVGFGAGEGIFSTGGSNGNLMGLLCARDKKFPDAHEKGINGKQLIAFVSEDSHYSTSMAANVSGIGMDNLIAIPTDDDGKMIPKKLKESIAAEKRAGNLPFIVIATAGTTVRGAIDPINELAEICKQEYLWLHVDAAWGGAALLSSKTRSLLDGIEKADSICWDPHKMMGIHLVCSIFLVKDSGTLKKACSHTKDAHYLLLEESENVDLGRLSLQCGRRVDALKLWLAWRARGNAGWETLVDGYFDLADGLAKLVQEHPSLELACPNSLTNVCIRYVGGGLTDEMADKVTSEIRGRLISSGRFMVSISKLNGRPIIRAVIANPRVDSTVISELVSEIVSHGDDIRLEEESK